MSPIGPYSLGCDAVEEHRRWLLSCDEALDYAFSRGLTFSSIGHYKLGFEPRKISKLHNRLLFPVFDHVGTLVSIQGRAIRDDVVPKYYHTKFNKRDVVYGLFDVAEMAVRIGTLAVVEGNIDALSFFEEGVPAVATQGSQITSAQAGVISRFVSRVVVYADSDEAGKKGAANTCETLAEWGIVSSLVKFEEVKDATEARQKYGSGFLRSSFRKEMVRQASYGEGGNFA